MKKVYFNDIEFSNSRRNYNAYDWNNLERVSDSDFHLNELQDTFNGRLVFVNTVLPEHLINVFEFFLRDKDGILQRTGYYPMTEDKTYEFDGLLFDTFRFTNASFINKVLFDGYLLTRKDF
jgi:hypothetical protein